MGVRTNLIVVAFFLIVIVIFWSTFAPVFAGLFDSASGFFTATELKPRPQQDEFICDLRIKVFGDLETRGIFPFETIFVKIDPDNSHSWNYFECEKASTFSIFNLIDLEERFDRFVPDFLTSGGETISVQIVIRDANDPTQKVDANTQPHLKQDILLSESFGDIPTPFNVDKEFVITNIPLREYDLEIFYGRIINNLDAGDPFETKICDQFSDLRPPTTCIKIR